MKLLVSTDYSLITMKAYIFLLLRGNRSGADEVFLYFLSVSIYCSGMHAVIPTCGFLHPCHVGKDHKVKQ
jgi:hypothetical protein